jgi:hypothetical protein
MRSVIGESRKIFGGACVVLLAALLAAPVPAQETITTIEADGSARTVSGGFEHTAPAGPGTNPPDSPTGVITPVGPFTGEKSEGFDTQVIGDPFPVCVEDRVFNDQADLCSTGGCAHITPGWAFGCVIGPNNTPRLYGSCDGFSIYTFDVPVVQFGGYFGSNVVPAPTATASLYDPNDDLIGTVDITIAPNCAWTWNGWSVSGTSISRVEVVSSVFGGAFVMMDDMEILYGGGGDGGGDGGDPVPATSNVGVLVLVALVLTAMVFFIIVGRRKLA